MPEHAGSVAAAAGFVLKLLVCACHVLHALAATAVQWQAAACCKHHLRVFKFAECLAHSGEGRSGRGAPHSMMLS
jgi:hypothetical protein